MESISSMGQYGAGIAFELIDERGLELWSETEASHPQVAESAFFSELLMMIWSAIDTTVRRNYGGSHQLVLEHMVRLQCLALLNPDLSVELVMTSNPFTADTGAEIVSRIKADSPEESLLPDRLMIWQTAPEKFGAADFFVFGRTFRSLLEIPEGLDAGADTVMDLRVTDIFTQAVSDMSLYFKEPELQKGCLGVFVMLLAAFRLLGP